MLQVRPKSIEQKRDAAFPARVTIEESWTDARDEGVVTCHTQIADALDRAHRAGVRHRDVRPSNIMLTRDGVKALDFRLAKSTHKPGATEGTLTTALTAEGTAMGRPQHVAPEQLEGKEADARGDI